MKEGIMGAEVLFGRTTEQETVHTEQKSVPRPAGWNPDNFAREQIRGLVRHVFFSNVERPVRQVIFSAVDPETDVKNICRLVGEALALETTGSIAVAGKYPQALPGAEICGGSDKDARAVLRQSATRVRGNLWLVPAAAFLGCGENGNNSAWLLSRLGELRREFDFALIHASPAGEADGSAVFLGHLADGLVLALDAHRTRRRSAMRIREQLSAVNVRLLGTVLRDRVFPIPEKLYRRL